MFAIVSAPASLAVASPDTAENIYFLTLSKSDLLFVPPPPSSTMISSASTRSAPISVPPSISNADNATLPAVDIVASFVSAIAALDLISAFTMFVIVLLSESIDLFVSVAVDAVDTNLASPPVLGNVRTLLAASECGAAIIVCP